MASTAPSFRDTLVVTQARHHTACRQLARRALAQGDRVATRRHLAEARRAARFVRAVAADCEREFEAEAWLAERAALPAPEVSDSDFGAFLDAAQSDTDAGGTEP